jgi:2,4-dichlorophenol 6-monooxygenase
VRDYVASGRPGARVPHAWIAHAGTRLSILDLLPYDRFTVLAGCDGTVWAEAVRGLGDAGVACLVAGRDFTDRNDEWAERAGIGHEGALLVRPDQHVAWRAPGAVAKPVEAIVAVLTRVLARG